MYFERGPRNACYEIIHFWETIRKSLHQVVLCVSKTMRIHIYLNGIRKMFVVKSLHFSKTIRRLIHQVMFCVSKTIGIHIPFWKVSKSWAIHVLPHQGNNTFQKRYFFECGNDILTSADFRWCDIPKNILFEKWSFQIISPIVH